MRQTRGKVLLAFLISVALVLASPAFSNAGRSVLESDAVSPSQLLGKLPSTVTLTAEQIKDREITVDIATAGVAESTLQAPATAQFVREHVTKIGPRLDSKVVKATVSLGDTVKRGDTVAILESVELGKAKARYLTVRSGLELAREKYERENRLADQQISSKAELEQARAEFEQARAEFDSVVEELRLYGLSRKEIEGIQSGIDKPFSQYALTSSQAGIVEKLDVTPGQTLTPEMTPIEVVNPARMWVMIDAFEKEIGRIKAGQQVKFRFRAIPDAQFFGTVDWIARELSSTTRTLQVRATVSNTDGTLRAGMFGTAFIEVGGAAKCAVLPVDAIQTMDGENIVFRPVKGQANTFEAVPVQTGEESAGRVEILSGLSAGEQVVVKGSFALMSILTAGTRQDTD